MGTYISRFKDRERARRDNETKKKIKKVAGAGLALALVGAGIYQNFSGEQAPKDGGGSKGKSTPELVKGRKPGTEPQFPFFEGEAPKSKIVSMLDKDMETQHAGNYSAWGIIKYTKLENDKLYLYLEIDDGYKKAYPGIQPIRYTIHYQDKKYPAVLEEANKFLDLYIDRAKTVYNDSEWVKAAYSKDSRYDRRSASKKPPNKLAHPTGGSGPTNLPRTTNK